MGRQETVDPKNRTIRVNQWTREKPREVKRHLPIESIPRNGSEGIQPEQPVWIDLTRVMLSICVKERLGRERLRFRPIRVEIPREEFV